VSPVNSVMVFQQAMPSFTPFRRTSVYCAKYVTSNFIISISLISVVNLRRISVFI